jgi:tetratricopeptide (TPR) repeat protein
MNLSPNFAFFLSGDGGMYLPINSFYEVGSLQDASAKMNAVNLPQGSFVNDFTESFFGGHAEAGAQIMLSEGFGLSLYGGYRIATMPITFKDNGTVTLKDANNVVRLTKTGVFNATSLDMSGPYFGASMVVYLGAEKAASAGAAAKPAAGGTNKYEQYGNYYFKQKNYKYALQYFNAAYKLTPTAAILKKIGFCYYYMKDKVKALQTLEKYLSENPNDTQIINWIKSLQK